MKIFKILSLAAITVVLQMMFAEIVGVYKYIPSLYTLVFIYLVLETEFEYGVLAAIIMGLVNDLLSETAVGVTTALFIVVLLIVIKVKDMLSKRNFIVQFIIAICSVFFINVTYSIFLFNLYGSVSIQLVLMKSFIIALYSGLLAPFLFYLLSYIKLEKLIL